jgi:hypothetical protein
MGRGPTARKLIVSLPGRGLRLSSVVVSPHRFRGSYNLTRGRYRAGGRQWMAELNAVRANRTAARLILTFAATRKSQAPGDTIWITGAKVPLKAWQSGGWAYYCPAAEPYLATDNQGGPVWNDLSDNNVWASVDVATNASTGKLDIDYTNWNLSGTANGQVSYECTTQAP